MNGQGAEPVVEASKIPFIFKSFLSMLIFRLVYDSFSADLIMFSLYFTEYAAKIIDYLISYQQSNIMSGD